MVKMQHFISELRLLRDLVPFPWHSDQTNTHFLKRHDLSSMIINNTMG